MPRRIHVPIIDKAVAMDTMKNVPHANVLSVHCGSHVFDHVICISLHFHEQFVLKHVHGFSVAQNHAVLMWTCIKLNSVEQKMPQ